MMSAILRTGVHGLKSRICSFATNKYSCDLNTLAQDVQKVYSAIYRINQCPVEKYHQNQEPVNRSMQLNYIPSPIYFLDRIYFE